MAETLGGKNVGRMGRPLVVAMLASVGLANCASGQGEAPITTVRDAATTTVAPPGTELRLQVCRADLPYDWEPQPATPQDAEYVGLDPSRPWVMRVGVAECNGPHELGRIAVAFPGTIIIGHCRIIAGEGSPGNDKVLAACVVPGSP